jgi:hypothetical protein
VLALCSVRAALGKQHDHAGQPYCSSCYTKSFGPLGYGISRTGIAGNYGGELNARLAKTGEA